MTNRQDLGESNLRKQWAERRVRAGDAYADIARDLRISQSTLGNWAAEGRWRKKDIAFELDEERGRALLAEVAETTARQQEEAARRAARAKELGEAAMKAMQAADPDGTGAPGMKPPTTHQLSLGMAHTLLQQGRLDEADRAARFALRFAQAQKATNDRDSAQWRADREKILAWYKQYQDGFAEFHAHASESIAELQSMVKFERRAREEGLCPTCTRPANFWPTEMFPDRNAAFERIEEKALTEEGEEANPTAPDSVDRAGF